MTRRVWITESKWPLSAEELQAATAAGASEILHRPLPSDLAGLADGYHEIPTPEISDVPATIKASQARVALHRAGLLTSVTALVDDPATDQEIKIFWEYEVDLDRTSPALNAMASALGLTSQQLDDLFRTASQVAI